MAEDATVFDIGKWVHTFWVFFGKKIEKTEYIGMMQKFSVVISSEELFEVKGNVLVSKVAQQSAKVYRCSFEATRRMDWGHQNDFDPIPA